MTNSTLQAANTRSTGSSRQGAWGRSGMLALVGIALLVAGPWIFDSYVLNLLIKAFLFSIVVITVDVLWGYTGYLTFGQSAFFGIGAYAAGLVFTHFGLSPGTIAIAIGLAIVVPMVVAGLVGWLSFYRGASPFFATVISLVLPIVMTQLLLSGGEWTGSSSGLTGYDTFDLSLNAWYWIAGSGVALIGLFSWLFLRSDAGRVLASIRDNESRCAYLGINVPTMAPSVAWWRPSYPVSSWVPS
jgi:branched-chain amino acid transport system permease protein